MDFRKVPDSGYKLTHLVQGRVDEVNAPRVATTKAEKEVERQKGLVFIVKKSVNNAFDDVTNFHGRVAVSSMREEELLSSVSAASRQIVRSTTESR